MPRKQGGIRHDHPGIVPWIQNNVHPPLVSDPSGNIEVGEAI